MSVYSLHPFAETPIREALTHGGKIGITLIKPEQELRALIHVEKAGSTLEAVVKISNTTNSITLQADDTANAQHLADFIEAIANGTAGTAEETAGVPHFSRIWVSEEELKHLHQGGSQRPPVRNPPPYNHTVVENAAGFNAARPAELRPDMVNHPPHYTGHPSGVECIEVAEHLPFCLGNAFKYLFRRNDKGSRRQNLEKALWYIRRERDYRATSSAEYMLSDEAMRPLSDIIWSEPAPYSHIMELVGRGIMLDLAEQMLVDVIAGMPD